jgi:hypothetical protein
MRPKFALATVLCLAAAALASGAAPALARDGCDCHTAVPPTNGAPAAHTPFVAIVSDCTVCHTDWVVPHPHAEAPWLFVDRTPYVYGTHRLSGFVGVGVDLWIVRRHPGVVVYLQERAWGETAFTDLGQVTTGAKGRFDFRVASPPRFATYRAIAQGHVGARIGGGTALFKPAVTVPSLMIPVLKLKLQGVTNGTVKIGHSVTANGTVSPADIGVKAIIRVQERVADKWVTRTIVYRALSATGTFTYRFTPRELGVFRVKFRMQSTEEWEFAVSPTRQFRVH